jgi:hypothetical protein
MESPGQLIKHYAPNLPCYTVSFDKLENCSKQLLINNLEGK